MKVASLRTGSMILTKGIADFFVDIALTLCILTPVAFSLNFVPIQLALSSMREVRSRSVNLLSLSRQVEAIQSTDAYTYVECQYLEDLVLCRLMPF
jgi:hypothetical protein